MLLATPEKLTRCIDTCVERLLYLESKCGKGEHCAEVGEIYLYDHSWSDKAEPRLGNPKVEPQLSNPKAEPRAGARFSVKIDTYGLSPKKYDFAKDI